MRSFDVFFDLWLNRQLSKKWRRRWFETTSRSLWRHCNVYLLHRLYVYRRRIRHQTQHISRRGLKYACHSVWPLWTIMIDVSMTDNKDDRLVRWNDGPSGRDDTWMALICVLVMSPRFLWMMPLQIGFIWGIYICWIRNIILFELTALFPFCIVAFMLFHYCL